MTFDGDCARKFEIARDIHNGHAAAAQLSGDVVRTERRLSQPIQNGIGHVLSRTAEKLSYHSAVAGSGAANRVGPVVVLGKEDRGDL